MVRKVVITWQVSSFFGWGVYGLNLALNWARDPDVQLLCARQIPLGGLALDPLSREVIQPFLKASAELVETFRGHEGETATGSGPVLSAFNETFMKEPMTHGVLLNGRPDVGVTFLETAPLRPAAVERARRLPLILAGSSWNAAVLRAHGLEQVRTVLQGVEPALFHPAPRRGLLGDRFLVFSGGKAERRKGQDLVLSAFKVFAARHPEALLVTAWSCPWPELARSLDASGLAAPVRFRADGALDVVGWAAASGLPAAQILDLGEAPNAAMAPLLREMDVALFPNRCEGGTNLVAMEAMACGVPTILSANTGHLDLIGQDNCYPLTRQGELAGVEGPFEGVGGWGESDVDEIVAALESVHADREAARRRGLRGAETLAPMSWARTAAEVKAAVLDVC
ncbi:MAG TPA: glycosyltransferase family 4 protein [Phenylobacterium sp.]|nr:glycosyltransferase family 4 protein [Phenylobacterium sp.]